MEEGRNTVDFNLCSFSIQNISAEGLGYYLIQNTHFTYEDPEAREWKRLDWFNAEGVQVTSRPESKALLADFLPSFGLNWSDVNNNLGAKMNRDGTPMPFKDNSK